LSEIVPFWGYKDAVAAFVASQPPFDRSRGWGEYEAIGFLLDNKLVAGVVFNNFDPVAGVIEMSAAATDPRWITRKSLLAVFGYVFDVAGCQMAVWRVAESNARLRSIARRIGFTEYVIPRLYGRHEAGTVQTLTAEQWTQSRFRRREIGQAERAEGT
jgi:RimJ/RimL family protein N-acetyltransferase